MKRSPRAVRRHLENAVTAYGEDLPLRVRKPRAAPARATSTPQPEAAAQTPTPPRSPRQPGTPAAAPDAATTLRALAAELAGCTACKLSQGRTNVVFGEGSPKARVMFVGEAPGQTEDETGRPFVGRAGQLLTKIIENAMGLARADVYIANINKCRPPGNRVPEPDEVAACLPHLRRQIEIVRPEVIVCLGKTAVSNLLGETRAVGVLRGAELSFAGTPVVVTWHPAYLLRNPAAKPDTWQDIKRVNRMLGLPEDPRLPPPTSQRSAEVGGADS